MLALYCYSKLVFLYLKHLRKPLLSQKNSGSVLHLPLIRSHMNMGTYTFLIPLSLTKPPQLFGPKCSKIPRNGGHFTSKKSYFCTVLQIYVGYSNKTW